MGRQQHTRDDQSTWTDPQHQGTTQVGTHGNQSGLTGQESGRPQDERVDPSTREMRQGDRTDRAMPSGTTPLDREQRPGNTPPMNQQR